MKNQYEVTIVVDAHLSNEVIEAVVQKYVDLIEKNQGAIKEVDRWGKRRLAYEIAKKQYGYYVYIRFEAEGVLILEMERLFKLDESIIRFLTIKLPKNAIKQEENQKNKIKHSENESSESSDDDENAPVRKSKEFDSSGNDEDAGDTDSEENI
jgi:small subunit ribosomal protein S6